MPMVHKIFSLFSLQPFEGGYVTTEQAEADSIPVNIG
jgi:hypothetical protein